MHIGKSAFSQDSNVEDNVGRLKGSQDTLNFTAGQNYGSCATMVERPDIYGSAAAPLPQGDTIVSASSQIQQQVYKSSAIKPEMKYSIIQQNSVDSRQVRGSTYNPTPGT